MQKIPQYIDEREVSKITGRALSTLRNDRYMGRGFPYCKIGKSVRYLLDDVLAYVEAGRIKTTGSCKRESKNETRGEW
jgi:hypothetical protein